MPRVRPPYYVLGVHGLAVLRNWIRGDDAVAPRVSELTEFAASLERKPLFGGIELNEDNVARGYEQWSETYDDAGNPLIALEQPLVRGWIDQVAAGRALDAACGTGRHTEYLVMRGFDTTGVDATPAMLERARVKVPGARFAQGELTALELRDASFDLVVCALAIDHCAELGKAVSELARVARRGATVIVSVFHPMSAMLGGGAFYRGADGRYGIVRSQAYTISDYVTAFVANRLDVAACAEPAWGEGEIAMMATAQMAPASFHAALSGIPCALAWKLIRR